MSTSINDLDVAFRLIPYVKLTDMERDGYKEFYELMVHKVLKWKWKRVANIDFIYIEIPDRFCHKGENDGN